MGKRQRIKAKNKDSKKYKKKMNKKIKKNQEKKLNKDCTTNNKSIFHGVDGNKYDQEGKEQEFSDDEINNNNEPIFETYLHQYLKRIKESNKATKAREYLLNFENKNWKFNKNNQIFILKFILYEKVFSNDFFEIFKNYIVKMHPNTKDKFIKQCEQYIQKYKDDSEDNNKMTFNIHGHDLKYKDIEKKNEFLKSFQNRCIAIIENN